MAPVPKTKAEHDRDGSFRPNRHAGMPSDADFAGAIGKIPTDFKGVEKRLWSRVVKSFPPEGLRRLDTDALEAMCRWYGQYHRIMQRMAEYDVEDGPYFKLVTLAGIAWKHAATAMTRFGLTPADRAKLRMPVKSKDDDDPLDMLKNLGAARN